MDSGMMSGSMRGTRRPSYTQDAHVRGDPSRRKMVPMPRGVDELRGHAARHFNFDRSNMKMHHQGRYALEHDGHLGPVEHLDVIVVHSKRSRSQPLVTTHKTDFQPHKIEPPTRAVGHRPPIGSMPFEGRSHYMESYPEHPIKLEPRGRPTTPYVSLPFEGDTTYNMDFPGHPVAPARSLTPAHRPTRSVPFEGKSHYHEHFVPHKLEPRRMKPDAPALVRVPFEGSTTYNNDFYKHPMEAPPMPSMQRTAPPRLPFTGNTEYGTSYVEKPMEAPTYVFIEPAESVTSSQF